MARFLNRLTATALKYTIEVTIHSLNLGVSEATSLEIYWKRSNRQSERKISATNSAIRAVPDSRCVEIEETLRMQVSIYQKPSGKIIPKKIVLKILSQNQTKDNKVGLVKIFIEDLSDLPIQGRVFALRKCSDVEATICLSIIAEPLGKPHTNIGGVKELDSQLIDLKEKQGHFIENIQGARNQSAKMQKQIDSLIIEKTEIKDANKRIKQDIQDIRDRIQRKRETLHKKQSKIDELEKINSNSKVKLRLLQDIQMQEAHLRSLEQTEQELCRDSLAEEGVPLSESAQYMWDQLRRLKARNAEIEAQIVRHGGSSLLIDLCDKEQNNS